MRKWIVMGCVALAGCGTNPAQENSLNVVAANEAVANESIANEAVVNIAEPAGADALAQLSADEKPRAKPSDFPKVGSCQSSEITLVSGRFDADPAGESGSVVQFKNGITQGDYDPVPAIVHSKVGDKVQMCVTKLPENCPADDLRGVFYKTTNLRTKESWELPDAMHMCGGA